MGRRLPVCSNLTCVIRRECQWRILTRGLLDVLEEQRRRPIHQREVNEEQLYEQISQETERAVKDGCPYVPRA